MCGFFLNSVIIAVNLFPAHIKRGFIRWIIARSVCAWILNVQCFQVYRAGIWSVERVHVWYVRSIHIVVSLELSKLLEIVYCFRWQKHPFPCITLPKKSKHFKVIGPFSNIEGSATNFFHAFYMNMHSRVINNVINWSFPQLLCSQHPHIQKESTSH